MSREGLEVQVMALSEIAVGGSAVVASIELPNEVGDHLMHLGFLPDATIAVAAATLRWLATARRAERLDEHDHSIHELEAAW